MNKRYEMLWKGKDGAFYSNYASNKKELKEKLDYFVNVKGLKLNDTDEYDNIQVSKKIGSKWLILTENEVMNEIQ